MDTQRVKLILKNMESLIRCLYDELDSNKESATITPFITSDYDEVFIDED